MSCSTPSPLPIESLVGRRLGVLAGFMESRPASAALVKVIALDGSDRHAVHGLIPNLDYRITRDPRYIVRVISEESLFATNTQPTESSHLTRRI